MRMRFAPGRLGGYRAVRDLLIRRGLAWACDRGLPADAFIWSVALDFRHESTDGRLGRWTVVDAQRLLGRYIPREVAAAAAWLRSDQTSFVTGVVLPVDGGSLPGSGAGAAEATRRPRP